MESTKTREPTSISNENFRFPGKSQKTSKTESPSSLASNSPKPSDTESPRLNSPKSSAETAAALSGHSSGALEEAEKLLQSPIETHFAVTPVSHSQAPSPANGFTSLDCSDILCQELDKLDQEQILSVQKITGEDGSEKPTELKLDDTILTLESLLSPTEENISMFTRNNEEATTTTITIEPEEPVLNEVEVIEEDYQGEVRKHFLLIDACVCVLCWFDTNLYCTRSLGE